MKDTINKIEIHPCKQEREIGEITALLGKISKDVYGNGELGLVKTVPRLEGKINELVGNVASHTKVISDFITFQATHDGKEKGKKEVEEKDIITQKLKTTEKRDNIQRRFLYVSAILIFLGLVINSYFGFRNSKIPAQLEETKETISNSIDGIEGISKVTRSGYVKYNEQGLSDSIKIR